MLRRFLLIIFFLSTAFPYFLGHSQKSDWQKLDTGLFWQEFNALAHAPVGDSKITVLKIDPNEYEFKLLCASENDGKNRTVSKWAEDYNLIAAVNAGMFQEDMLTNIGYMKNFEHVNNSAITGHNAFFAFNALDSLTLPAQIIDRTCQNFDSLEHRYNTIFQNIRMIDCSRENVWKQQKGKRWSMVVLGMDEDDNILFIFTRSPYTVHDFVNMLKKLPLSLKKAMYLEGGAKATLFVSAKELKLAKFGAFENTLIETKTSNAGWAVPNVLGIIKR